MLARAFTGAHSAIDGPAMDIKNAALSVQRDRLQYADLPVESQSTLRAATDGNKTRMVSGRAHGIANLGKAGNAITVGDKSRIHGSFRRLDKWEIWREGRSNLNGAFTLGAIGELIWGTIPAVEHAET